jgi:hypothetical protein
LSQLLSNLGRPIDELILLNTLINSFEKSNIVFASSEGNTLGLGEVSGGLGSLSESEVVSLDVGLPEALAGSSAAGGGLINDESGLEVVSDGSESAHELLRGNISCALLGWLDNDGSNDSSGRSLLSHGRSNMIQDLALLSL